MGLLRAAAGLFVELPTEEKAESSAVKPLFASPSTAIPAAASPRMSSADLEKFEAHFNDLFDQANLPGPDYYEFSKVLESLEKPIPDEKTRMAAAYASLAVQGLKKETLISSAATYLDVIKKDREGFEKAIQSKENSEISSRQQQIDQMKKRIEQINIQIQSMTKDITDTNNAMEKLNTEIAETHATIQKNEEAYIYACDAITNKIQSDVKRIQTEL